MKLTLVLIFLILDSGQMVQSYRPRRVLCGSPLVDVLRYECRSKGSRLSTPSDAVRTKYGLGPKRRRSLDYTQEKENQFLLDILLRAIENRHLKQSLKKRRGQRSLTDECCHSKRGCTIRTIRRYCMRN